MNRIFGGTKGPLLLGTMAGVVGLDLTTKHWAVGALLPGESLYVLRGTLPLTLAYNQGAAFSLSLGPGSRWIFLLLSVAALVVLAPIYRATREGDRARLLSIALVASGAVGNLIDRVRWSGGVVDFIGPIDLGFTSWPIFNVADMAITAGALLLAFSLWRQGELARASERVAESRPDEYGPAAAEDV